MSYYGIEVHASSSSLSHHGIYVEDGIAIFGPAVVSAVAPKALRNARQKYYDSHPTYSVR